MWRLCSFAHNEGVCAFSCFSSSPLWHDVPVPDESHSERLRRESDELLETAAKLIEHAETLKTRAAELQKQIARLQRGISKPTKKKT
jgi:hypothetical protein